MIPYSIVSASKLFRDGLAALLGEQRNLKPVGCYPALPVEVNGKPNPPGHVVLIDGALSPENLIAWSRVWRTATPPARVLMIEMAHDSELILACIAAGAGGYTLIGASTGEVVDAIYQVHQGIAQCSPEITARLFARLEALQSRDEQTQEPAPALTTRELEVLSLIAQDRSNREIAQELVIEVRTVKHHVHNILRKLGLRHRWDAARVAAEQGWLHAR